MKKLAIFIGISLCSQAWAQTSIHKTAIKFVCSCDDTVGTRFAAALRDAIAESPRYTETQDYAVKGNDGKDISENWSILVVSMDTETPPTNMRATFSVVFGLGDSFFLTHYVQICGINKIKDCAAGTLADLDSQLSKLRNSR